MFKTKIKILLLSLLLATQPFLALNTSAATLNVRAYGTDTVAGYPSILKTSMLSPGKKVIFVVEKPDLSIVQIQTQADLQGVAKVDLYGNQTKLAGTYHVAVYYPGTKNASPQNTFAVFPDKVSPTQSTVSATSKMVQADGVSQTFLTVALYDAYRNPVPNHQVKLISSLPNVKAEALNAGTTDKQGRASFKVTSPYAGVSTFTPLDVSSNTVLEAREEISFYAPNNLKKEIGGNYYTNGLFMADVLNDQNVLPGPVSSFDIQDVPASVKVNTDQTITIVAKDKDGNIAKNYTGTIVISTPDDDNATLPGSGQYTFKESDQGKFTFNLALRFSQLGNQTIQVVDKNNWQIKGEFKLAVISDQGVNQPSNDSLVIKAPLDGATFGNNSVLITGQGDPNINLSVFADAMKVADTQTDIDGFFSYQLANLSGGSHAFYVMSGQGQVSDTVNINIDTLPPVLNSLKITPDGPLSPGKMIAITVNSEPNLNEVKVRLQGTLKELFPVQGQLGNYSGNLAVPAIVGNFPLDVILTDDLANKSELLNQKTISVQNAVLNAPPQVDNLKAMVGDSQVSLTWQAVTGHTTTINSYRVYYGTKMTALDKVVQTSGSTPLYKVSGLTNGAQYFFAVTAIDSKGVESQQKSQLIAATPLSAQQVLNASGNSANNNQSQPIDDQGIDLFDFDLYGSNSVNNASQTPAQTQNDSPQANPLTGLPTDNGMSLSWQAFPGISASGYKVYFGLNSGQYDDYMLSTLNQATVSDLINEIPYYFAVVAIDSEGKEISPLSAEFSGKPSGSGFHSSAPSNNIGGPSVDNFQLSKVPSQGEAGSAAKWTVLISILVAGGFYLGRKKLIS